MKKAKRTIPTLAYLYVSILCSSILSEAFTYKSCIQNHSLISSLRTSDNIVSTHAYRPNKNNDDQSTDSKSLAAGALLGGLLGGPFGLLFGAQIGANLGQRYASEKAQKAEMDRLGITPEMLQMAEEVGVALERATEGLEATRESLESLQRLARRLDETNENLLAKAQEEIKNGREDEARKLLLEKQTVQEKLKKTLMNCKDEKIRFERMEKNMEAIGSRALEVDALLKRTVGAKALKDSSDTMGMVDSFRVEDEDPLLRKFKDLERE